MGERRWKVLVALVAVLSLGAPGLARADGPDPRNGEDHLETGLQGQVPLADQESGRSREGSWKGLKLVGSDDLDGQGVDIQLTWYDECAYANVGPAEDGGPDGIAVIDVHDPTDPELVQVIRNPALGDIHEGLHANAERGILVAPSSSTSILGVYDIHDCRYPRHITDFDTTVLVPSPTLKTGLHSGKLTPDGQFFYGTNGYIAPCVVIVDLGVLTQPELVGTFGDFGCHDLDFNLEGTRAYVGWGGGEQLPGVFVPGPAARADDAATGVRIIDITDFNARLASPEFRVVGEATGGRSHTETPFRVGNRSFVLAAEEGACPGGDARIVDVTDETAPRQVAELGMEVNRVEHCAETQPDIKDRGFLFYTSHYISVDDPANASLAFVSWYSSGLRVFDVRNPDNPVEIAYYNPPVGPDGSAKFDTTTTYSRWVPETRQIWFGSWISGFQVVQLTQPLPAVTPGTQDPTLYAVPPSSGTSFRDQYALCVFGIASARSEG